MGTDDENKEKNFDELSELLKKYYKPPKELDAEELWESTSKKIESLFHKEIISDKKCDSAGIILSDEERYWTGLEEYIQNKVSSLRHKTITDHLLRCKECRVNYTKLLDKKKVIDEGKPSTFYRKCLVEQT